MNLDRIQDVSHLDIDLVVPDFRRDLYVFAQYVRDRDIKRSHRDNTLSKTDCRRLAKLFSDPEAKTEIAEDGYSIWIGFIDRLAHRLGLVHYDTTGVYAGYTSAEPSFPDNYMKFDATAYEKLISMTLARREKYLLDSLLKATQGGGSEFFSSSVLGRLDPFPTWGSALGVVPTLDFAAVRRFLLDLLARCPTGQWLSVASLVEHLKNNHPNFLIPKQPKLKNKWERKKGRYGNFHESTRSWGHEIDIQESDPDAFERVEGRYVERFLEGIPKLFGYVDVAYTKQPPKGVHPTRGWLQAFRVSERLSRALEGKIAEPTVRVTPTFELYVQSETYPARLLRDVSPLSELVSEQTAIVLRLDRKKVAAACAADSSLDVIPLLESWSTEPLPPNVRRELSDWSAHGEKFIVYTGCSLLETDGQAADVERFLVENIDSGICLVRSSAGLYEELEQRQLAPLRIQHGEMSFARLPAQARSVFPRQTAASKKPEPKPRVTLLRVTRVRLLCPDRAFLDRLQGLLAAANCPVEADRQRLLLEYSQQYEKEVSRAVRSLKNEFEVILQDQ